MVFLLLLMGGAAGGIIVFGQAAHFLRDEYLEQQPVVEEVHTLIFKGNTISRSANGSYGDLSLRTRSANGEIFMTSVDNRQMWICEVGQTIVVERQGMNIRLTDEGCTKRTANLDNQGADE